MSWLAPGFLVAGVLGALVVVALHLVAWQRPPARPLPTARFVPEGAARARARTPRPTDLLLLALRAGALLLLGAAFARPVARSDRAPLARVVVADVSASVRDVAAVRAAAAREWRAGDALLAMDTAARAAAEPDSLPATRAGAAGRLSAALVATRDAAGALAATADSVELVLVSPVAREELDAATPALAGAWGGRARQVRVAADSLGMIGAALRVEGAGDDDAVAAGAEAGAVRARAEVRLVRREPTAGDSAWAREGRGRVLVAWPAAAASAGDSTRALAWGADALVAPLAPSSGAPEGRAIVRWADGTPAAAERALGEGCLREVRVAIPVAGDVTLSTGFARLLAFLGEPCGGPRDLAPVAPGALGFRADGPARALARPLPRDPWRAARWLLGAAVALLLAEMLLRDRRVRTEAARPDAMREAA